MIINFCISFGNSSVVILVIFVISVVGNFVFLDRLVIILVVDGVVVFCFIECRVVVNEDKFSICGINRWYVVVRNVRVLVVWKFFFVGISIILVFSIFCDVIDRSVLFKIDW